MTVGILVAEEGAGELLTKEPGARVYLEACKVGLRSFELPAFYIHTHKLIKLSRIQMKNKIHE
jgi:hypothetical protein